MYETKKQKKYLKEINNQLEQIQKEKEELELIKTLLTDNSPKIDISNLYVLYTNGIHYIVEKKEREIIGTNIIGITTKGYESMLIDIFTNQAIINQCSIERLEKNINFINKQTGDYDEGTLTPIINIEHSLLVFIDQKVPLYVLQQLYYKLNNIDITKDSYVKSLNKNLPPM